MATKKAPAAAKKKRSSTYRFSDKTYRLIKRHTRSHGTATAVIEQAVDYYDRVLATKVPA